MHSTGGHTCSFAKCTLVPVGSLLAALAVGFFFSFLSSGSQPLAPPSAAARALVLFSLDTSYQRDILWCSGGSPHHFLPRGSRAATAHSGTSAPLPFPLFSPALEEFLIAIAFSFPSPPTLKVTTPNICSSCFRCNTAFMQHVCV